MEQIIKLTTQMTDKAIREFAITSIINEANAQKELFDFESFFTTDNLNKILTQKMKISEVKNLISNKKKSKSKGKLNGYGLFVKKNIDVKEDGDFGKASKEASKKWRALSEDEKNVWKEKAAEYNSGTESDESDNEAPLPSKVPQPLPTTHSNDEEENEKMKKKMKKKKKKDNTDNTDKLKKKKKKKKKIEEKKIEESPPMQEKFSMQDVDDMFD